MKTISVHEKVYDLVKQNPEITKILLELGFHHIIDSKMLNTAGRIMTISKAGKLHKLTYEEIKQAFNKKDIELLEESL